MLVALSIAIVIACGVFAFYMPRLGFITGVIVSIALALNGVIYDYMELVAAAPLVLFISIIATVFSPRREGPRWVLVWARRILMVYGLIILGVGSVALFGQGGPFGLILIAMFVSAVIGAIASSEFARATYVITTIGSSMRQNLPLPMALEMAAAGRDDKLGWILKDIKKWIVEGYSLSESLRRGYPRCPGYVTALVAAGERIGQIPQAIAALEQDLTAKASISKKVRPVPLMYPPLVLIVLILILSFIMAFIMPKFLDVIRELTENMPLPGATRLLIAIYTFFKGHIFSVISLFLVFGILLSGVVYIRVKTRPRRPDKPYLISRIGDFIKWHMPFLGWYEWWNSMQRVVGMLRLSLNAGCTVNEAIANTLGLDVNGCFRTRLKEWLARVERGEDIGQSAGQCGLGSGLTWAFCDINNHSNTIAVLDTLETSYRWAYSRLAGLVRLIIAPCETLCLGLIVGFVLYAIFASLIAVITAVGSFVP
ncbi:MAG: type II secretion system F family protein [Sedimentisphaerales bacterium]|jgi:type II secretory pathway component PulF